MGPRTAAGPERGLGGEKSWTREGTQRWREHKPGLKRVGDTQIKPKSWDGAKNCRGTGTWTGEKKEAGLGTERKA